MVTGYEDLPAVGKLPKPLVEVIDCSSALAEHGEVARVDQDVPIRDVKFAVQLVRIGYTNDR
jgi:hypothetical protein